jgi:hypothetical protein
MFTFQRVPHSDLNEVMARRREVLLLVVGLVVLAAVGTRVSSASPTWSAVAFLMLLIACAAAVVRPITGVYVSVFFTLVGDSSTAPWWPFIKNLSSRESLMYVADGLSINPLEIVLASTILGFVLNRLVNPTWAFVRGSLFWPVLTFAFFVVVGFGYGQVTGGGDRRVAIFEARPLFYVPIIYLLVTNLFTTRRHYQQLLIASFVAITIQSYFALLYYRGLTSEEREELESLADHASTVHMNVLFVCFLALALLGTARRWRWMLLPLLVIVGYAYVVSQRRAAMVALFIGIGVVCLFTYFKRRRAFWVFAPAFTIIMIGVIAATWNAEGFIGLPAGAAKSVIAPDDVSAEDRSSDIYRQLEAFNLWFTIRDSPATGVGFGHKFLIARSMPDISAFEFWEYIPHNAMLWIWLKMGFLGFVATLYMFGRTIAAGAASIFRLERPLEVVTVLAGLAYVVMFMVFAYVDIAWDIRSTVFLGVCLALCADFVKADATPRPKPPRVSLEPGDVEVPA